jgi:F-type H+-transporting ATPase subunit b
MKFDIWTFLFQTINFIVLLFILKRLLFRPVRDILEKRRDMVRETVAKAEKIEREALDLKERHGQELRKLEELKGRMVDEMKAGVLEERRKFLSAAEKDAAAETEKALALFAMEKSRFEGELVEKAVAAVSLFSANLLQGISDRELHMGIWRRFLSEVGNISRDMAERGTHDEEVAIELESAYPLGEEEMGAMRSAMEKELSRRVTIHQTIDATLIAGVRLRSRDMVYDSSLAGQVSAFAMRLKETA